VAFVCPRRSATRRMDGGGSSSLARTASSAWRMTTGSMRVCGTRRPPGENRHALSVPPRPYRFRRSRRARLQRADPHLAAHHQQGPERRSRAIWSPHQDGSPCQGEWVPHGDLKDWRTVRFSWECLAPAPKVFRGVLSRRWVVERTFAWLCQNLRFSRDYWRLYTTSEALIYAAMGRLMLRRLARN
jgi:hypothetical protein